MPASAAATSATAAVAAHSYRNSISSSTSDGDGDGDEEEVDDFTCSTTMSVARSLAPKVLEASSGSGMDRPSVRSQCVQGGKLAAV